MINSLIIKPFFMIFIGYLISFYLYRKLSEVVDKNNQNNDQKNSQKINNYKPYYHYPFVMFPWNYSTWGPDTNRRTFEIGN